MQNLVHYTCNHSITDLLKSRLSVSVPSKFNDPFELHFADPPQFSKEDINRIKFQYMRDKRVGPNDRLDLCNIEGVILEEIATLRTEEAKLQLDQEWRVLCCAISPEKAENDILMWSHYADKHQGVRIHFDESFALKWRFSRMSYVDSPRTPLASDVFPSNFCDFVESLLWSKFKNAWESEDERRAFIQVSDSYEDTDVNGKNRSYIQISDSEILRVDLGIRFSDSLQKVEELRNKLPNLKIYRTVKCTKSYACRYEPI